MTKPDESTQSHDKPCTLCETPRSVLVRCQIDETGRWHFVCPGKCWTSVSGGVEDAKGFKAEHPHYRYGGMWKNKHADGPVSAKKPRKVKERQKRQQAKRQQEGQSKEEEAAAEEEEEASTDVEGGPEAEISGAVTGP